jgi:DNA repair protein RecN (Recombination protein N)
MPDVKIIFEISPDKVTIFGMDKIDILISVNKGENLKPIAKIASGGELSRIMLAIKTIERSESGTAMIFDEIDTGISGRAGLKVGAKMKEIATKSDANQVICITHLAQIASFSSNHMLIQKNTENERTYTRIFPLDTNGRKKELARIISGDSESKTAVDSATELLENADLLMNGWQ